MVLLSETGPSPVPFIPFPLSGPRGLGEPGGSPQRPGGLEVVAEAPCVPMWGKDRVKDPGGARGCFPCLFCPCSLGTSGGLSSGRPGLGRPDVTTGRDSPPFLISRLIPQFFDPPPFPDTRILVY